MLSYLLPLLLKPIAFPEPEEITRRRHLERWAQRARRRRKILIAAYLIGASPFVLSAAYFTALSAFKGYSISLNGLLFSFVPGLLCSGPILLVLTWMILSSGVSQYERYVGRLRVSNRVCSVCDVVSLYEDRYMIPRKKKKHTKADLFPRMHLIKEAGKTHVLCDKCLAEVHPAGSDL